MGQDADYYGLQGCQRWAKRTYCELQNSLQQYTDLVSVFTYILLLHTQQMKLRLSLRRSIVRSCEGMMKSRMTLKNLSHQ